MKVSSSHYHAWRLAREGAARARVRCPVAPRAHVPPGSRFREFRWSVGASKSAVGGVRPGRSTQLLWAGPVIWQLQKTSIYNLDVTPTFRKLLCNLSTCIFKFYICIFTCIFNLSTCIFNFSICILQLSICIFNLLLLFSKLYQFPYISPLLTWRLIATINLAINRHN